MKTTIIMVLGMLSINCIAMAQWEEEFRSQQGRTAVVHGGWAPNNGSFIWRVFDINKNGTPDIVTIQGVSGNERIVVLDRSTKETLFEYPITLPMQADKINFVGFFDFKNDGSILAFIATDDLWQWVIDPQTNNIEFSNQGVQTLGITDVDGDGRPEIIAGDPNERTVIVIGFQGGSNHANVTNLAGHLGSFAPSASSSNYQLTLKFKSKPNVHLAFDDRLFQSTRNLDIEGDGIADIVMLVEDENRQTTGMVVRDGGVSHEKKWQYVFPQEHIDNILGGFHGFYDVNGDGQNEAIFGDNIAVTLDSILHIAVENFEIRTIFDIDNDGFPDMIGENTADSTVQVWGASSPTGVSSEDLAASGFLLYQNYPNPFNPSTTISYSVAQSGQVELKVYDLLGRVVRVLIHENKIAGDYSIAWDGKNEFGRTVPSGNYFYRFKINDFQSSRQMLFLK